ncbi:hypothetical protein BG005_005730 [Podila minutissima]|nr:hypothetical protein BG005_005730 [Podila minutissima]
MCNIEIKIEHRDSILDIEFLTSAEIKSMDGTLLATAAIEESRLVAKDGYYELLFFLSDQPVRSVPDPPTQQKLPANTSVQVPAPESVLCEKLTEKLYRDSNNHDVFFVFSQSSDSRTRESENEGTDADTSGATQGTDTASETILGAHKLVLSQWPYFRTMFESGFAEGGVGSKNIRIRDTSPRAFQLLLCFMYTGKIPEDIKPTIVFMDPLNTQEEVSWESLYLVAHRYDIQDLCQVSRNNIVANLDTQGTVPFLFRSAHLFEDLREPVINYVANTCGPQIASREIRNKYKDHPDIVDILGELFEQHHIIHSK